MSKIKKNSIIFTIISVILIISVFTINAKIIQPKNYIGVEKAKEIALSHVNDAVVNKIKLEYDDGIMEYEIYLQDTSYKYEVTLNAVTGKLLDIEKDRIKSKTQLSGDMMDIESILKIAYEDAGCNKDDVIFVTYELDRDDATTLYELTFFTKGTKYEYEISAFDGTILEFEVEYSI